MKATATIFWILAGYFFIIGNVYSGWGLLRQGSIDWAGGTPLGLCSLLCAMIAYFIHRSRRSQTGELPQDRPQATIDDDDPEMGHFSPWSWWPFTLGAACFLLFLGFAVGGWLSLIGAPLAIISLIGWVYEYYRGYFAR